MSEVMTCMPFEQLMNWVLEEKKSGNIIGYITVDIPYDLLKVGELGYVIAEKYQHM